MKNPLLIITILFHVTLDMFGQKTLQVVTREIDEKMNFKASDTLYIEAENAEVDIKGWDKNYVSISLQLISKHEELEVAREELEYLKHEINRKGNRMMVRNFFFRDKGFNRVKGHLSVKYEIFTPYKCPVSVRHQYGNLSVENTEARLHANLSFVSARLLRISNEVDLKTNFGTLYCDQIDSRFTANMQKTNLQLRGLKGQVLIKSNYGIIDIEDIVPEKLSLEGERTKVNLLASRLDDYNFRLSTTFSEINIPLSLGDTVSENDLVTFESAQNSGSSSIEISTTYQPISIRIK